MMHMDSRRYEFYTFDVYVSDGDDWTRIDAEPQQLEQCERTKAAIELLGLEVRIVPHHSDDQIPCLS